MKYKLKSGLIFKKENGDMEIFQDLHPVLTLKNFSPVLEKVFSSLTFEQEEDDLINNLKEEMGESHLSVLFYILELLKKQGLLIYKTQLVELTPFNARFQIENRQAREPLQLSRFVICRSNSEDIVMETPLGSAQIIIQEKTGMDLFYALKKPSCFSEIKQQFSQVPLKELEETLTLLSSAKMLSTAKDDEASSQWEYHDLLFHARSRIGRHHSPYGGTYRFKNKAPSLPGVKNCLSKKTFSLPRLKNKNHKSFNTVLEERKTIRTHGVNPISFEQLSEFLFCCARVKKMQIIDNQEFTSRPYPGGGARYELELYPIVYQCKGLPQGIYHYHPLEHQLCEVSSFSDAAEKLLKIACQSSAKKEYPQILIVISARFSRVFWKYQSMGYALILKNLGILYQTMYLVATAMQLAPCALGGGDSDLFCEAIGTNYLEETSVGEFMLGSIS